MEKNIGQLVSVEFVGRLAGRAFGYGTSVTIARGLGADGLGTFAFALVALQLSSAIARGGLDTALLKFVPIDREDSSTLTGTIVIGLTTSALVSVILVGMLQFATLFIPAAAQFSIRTPIGLMLLGLPLFAVVRVSEAATRGFNETKYAVYIREFAMRGLGFVLVVAAILLFNEIRAVIGGYVLALVFAAGLGVFYLARLGGFEGIRSPTFTPRRVFTYSLPVAGVSITNKMVIWTDILMLGFLAQSNSVGFYRSAYQTAALLSFALISINAVFPPLASQFYEENRLDRLEKVYSTVTMWVAGLTTFAAIFAAVFASDILSIFGEQFAAAQFVLITLAVGRVVDAGVGPAGFLLSMTGNERLELLNTVAVALLNLGLNYILIQQYGIIGAAVATTTSLSLLNIVRLLEIRIMVGIWPYTSRILMLAVPLGAAFIVMLFGQSLLLPRIIRLVVVGALSFGIFLTLCWLLVANNKDRILIESI